MKSERNRECGACLTMEGGHRGVVLEHIGISISLERALILLYICGILLDLRGKVLASKG